MIDWRPIEAIPDALKDGRELLLGQWDHNVGGTANPQPDRWSSVVAIWSTWHDMSGKQVVGGKWQLAETGSYAEDGDLFGDPTHYAEINPPIV